MSTTHQGLQRTKPGGWMVRHRWIAAMVFALVPVFCTAAASAASQLMHADETTAALMIAGGAAVSAGVGVTVMMMLPSGLRRPGFGAPRRGRAALWFVPLLVTVMVVFATQGMKVSGPPLIAYGVLAMSVAVNEEVWFRGAILTVLRGGGIRAAIIGSSALFAVLHLANLAGGEDLPAALLQLAFAALFGIAAAEVTVLSGSLWPAIMWHTAWDFANYAGGNSTTTLALTGIGIACCLILAYALVMWAAATTPERKQPLTAQCADRIPS